MIHKRVFRIAVAGAGIAGLSAAILLAQQGHEIHVFERQHSVEGFGGGLLLQPCGLDVLRRVGVLDAAIACGSRIEKVVRRHRSGKISADLAYSELNTGIHALGITRGALIALLAESAAAVGVHVAVGIELTSIVNTTNGVTLLDRLGQAYGDFDALIVADGMRSRLREHVGLAFNISECSLGVWSVCAPRPAQLDGHVLLQQFEHGMDVIGLLPSGRDPQGVEWVTWFQNVALSGSDPAAQLDFNQWRRGAISVFPETAPILEPLKGFDDLHLSRYAVVSMPRSHTLRCIVIGDAAHALDPKLGMGANMALVDAAVLTDSITAAGSDQLSRAFGAYDERRQSQIARYRNAARYLSLVFEARGVLVPGLAEGAIRAALRVPAMRRRMIASMSGYI
jgi:2-polyprenyl-6-methoxyphenol hydroxylase-like FAD-dependent oxidoreductase